MQTQIDTQEILKNSVLFTKAQASQRKKEICYDHVLIYEEFRLFFRTDGKPGSPHDLRDSDNDGIPDYVISLLLKFVVARLILTQGFHLKHPLSHGYFLQQKAQYIDLKLQSIPIEHGLTSDRVYDEKLPVLENTPYAGKSARIIVHNNLRKRTATPMHELFHLFQFAYTPFNNMWFMEGLGRWSQSMVQKGTGKTETLPQTEEALKALLKKWHDAEFFWNRLTDLCESNPEFDIPERLRKSHELVNNQRSGSRFMPVFLACCQQQTQRLTGEQKSRQLATNRYWRKQEKRSANNNVYILRAILDAISAITPNPSTELANFTRLIQPVCAQGSETYNTPAIQKLMAFLQKYHLARVQIDSRGILYSHYYDCFSATLSIQDCDLSAKHLSNHDLQAFAVVEHIIGKLNVSENPQLQDLSGLSALRAVEGDVLINHTGIRELSGLTRLERIKGRLEIQQNLQLQSITGMDALVVVDQGIAIEDNPELQRISGFSILRQLKKKSLSIKNCPKLTVISGFEQLSDAQGIWLRNLNIDKADFLTNLFQQKPDFPGFIKIEHTQIHSVHFFKGLKRVASSFYLHHNQITSLAGLEQLTKVGASFSLSGNQLLDLRPLSKLATINGLLGLAHNHLSSLQGLENLVSIKQTTWNGHPRSILLNNNPYLYDISALSNVKEKGKELILMVDWHQYPLKPKKHTLFAQNKIQVLCFKKTVNGKEQVRKETGNKLLQSLPKVKMLFGNVWQHAVKKNSWIKAWHTKFQNREQILSLCKEKGIEIIFANNYNVQRFLQKHEESFRAKNIHFIVNTQFVIDTFVDKARFDQFMIKHGFADYIPQNYDTDEEAKFPCLIKAKSGGAGRGISLAYSIEDLKGVDRTKYRVSEYIPGTEYGSSIFFAGGKILRHYTYSKQVDKDFYILQQQAKKEIKTQACDTPFLDIFTRILQHANPDGESCQCSINFKILDNKPRIFEINCRMGYTLATHPDDYKSFMLFYIQQCYKHARNWQAQKTPDKPPQTKITTENMTDAAQGTEDIQFGNTKILLSPQDLAQITGGYWENLPADLVIYEVHHTFRYLQKNDLFVVSYKDWPNAHVYGSNEHKVHKAFEQGACAVMVREDCQIKTTFPMLRVKNTYCALKKIALQTSHRAMAKRVLVVGSYGKTAFKTHLFDVIKHQYKVYARLNSANYAASNYCNLASIKKDTEVFIMEQPISSKSKMGQRAGYVKPDIGVLTSIGHEHIERFGSIKGIIKRKTLIAGALSKKGIMIIPRDDPHYREIYKAVKKYPHIQILTFGSHVSCHARILYQQWQDFGWNIVARIEDRIVAYRIPFFEEYAPLASLPVLLAGYHLGADAHKMADEYIQAHNFKSSGNLYDVTYRGIHFQLYDQSARGGIEGYQSFFNTLRYIKPRGKGRKIVLTSEFVDYKDGEMELLDHADFQQRIECAKIDCLYTVEKFDRHQGVLKDHSIWKRHSEDFADLQEELIDSLKDNDFLCVKGIFESRLPEFIAYLRQLEDMTIIRRTDTLSLNKPNNALAGLVTIKPEDITRFNLAVRRGKQKAWCYYFPFLYFWSLSKNREVLMEEVAGSLCIYVLRSFNRQQNPKLDLYFPPIPFNAKALEHALHRIYQYRGKRAAKIFWVDREDVIRIRRHKQFNHLKFMFRSKEYMYQVDKYRTLSGRAFKYLRREISRSERIQGLRVEAYTPDHKEACLALLKKWKDESKEKYENIEDSTYTKNCLRYSTQFEAPDLRGMVFYIHDELKAFGFVGEIPGVLGNAFIGKSDSRVQGLFYYMKYRLLCTLSDNTLVNDSSDLGNPGLQFSKDKFRPVMMHKVYRAYCE